MKYGIWLTAMVVVAAGCGGEGDLDERSGNLVLIPNENGRDYASVDGTGEIHVGEVPVFMSEEAVFTLENNGQLNLSIFDVRVVDSAGERWEVLPLPLP